MTDEELEIGDQLLHGEVAIDMTPAVPALELNGHRQPVSSTPVGAGESH
jgi:hypothetical protein